MMPYENDYIAQLNLGSKSALQSAAPEASPTAPMPSPDFGFDPEQARRIEQTLPPPPPGYTPGPASPTRWEAEDNSPFQNLMDRWHYNKTGNLPFNFKLRLAQQEADFKRGEQKLAYDNYFKNNELVREQLKSHNRDAVNDFMQILPNIKAQITSIVDPAEAESLTSHWAKLADHMSPGAGEFVKFFHKNQGSVYAADAFLSDPDPNVSKPFLEMQRRMGYFEAVQSKEWQALGSVVNRDRAVSIIGRLPIALQTKLAAGTLNENVFRVAYKQAAMEAGLSPVKLAAAQSFLDSEAGQETMIGAGVLTNDLKQKKAIKEKPADLIAQRKNEQFEKNEELLAFAEKNPGVIDLTKVNAAKEQNAIALGDLQKETNTGANPNSNVNQRINNLSGGLYSSLNEANAVTGKAAPQAKAWAKQAMQERDEAAAQAQMQARMETPHEGSVFKFTNKGKLERVRGLSEGAYRTGTDTFAMSPAQLDKWAQLDQVENRGIELFNQASKAYKAKGLARSGEIAAEVAAGGGKVTEILGLKAASAANYPDIYAYVAARDSALGTFSKALGGEVGVLTDQDIARVRQMFNTASDNAFTRNKKKEAFQKLIAINRAAIKAVLVGDKDISEITPTQLEGLKNDPKIRSQIEGILGSVEGLPKDENIVPGNTKPTDKSKGVGSLMQDLEAGR